MSDETMAGLTDGIGPLGQAIAWLIVDRLAESVTEDRMAELIGEAIGVVVAAEHGEEEAQGRVLHAASSFWATIRGRKALMDALASRTRN